MAIPDLLDRGAMIDPEGPCIIMGEEQYFYREIQKLMNLHSFHSRETIKNILDFLDVEVLFYQSRFHDMVGELRPTLSKIELLVCIEQPQADVPGLMEWIDPFFVHKRPWR